MITKQQTAEAIASIQAIDFLRKKATGLNGEEGDLFRNSLQTFQNYVKAVEADKQAAPPQPPLVPLLPKGSKKS